MTKNELKQKRDELYRSFIKEHKGDRHQVVEALIGPSFALGFEACLNLTYLEIEKLQQRVEKLREALKEINGDSYATKYFSIARQALDEDDRASERSAEGNE